MTQSETKKELKVSLAKPLPVYTAHLVPCIINYEGSTSELPGNFDSEQIDNATSKQNPKEEVKYLRGRKIKGLPVEFAKKDTFHTYIVDESNNKIEYKVQDLFNYERDGNEPRLVREMERFQEFVQLTDTIMED